MRMETVDSSTRLYDREHIIAQHKWIMNQYSRAKEGAPRNTEKYKAAADEFLQMADAVMKLEAGIKKGIIPEIPEWLTELYTPKPKKVARQTQNNLVAVAPTTGQIQTMIQREVQKMKGDVIAAIQGLKVAK